METFQLIIALFEVACIAGCIVLFRKKPAVAGRLGTTVIVLGAAYFAVQVISFALTKEGAERLVLISTGIIVSPAVGYYWFRVWQRKRPDAVPR
jgi:hypothetical protein